MTTNQVKTVGVRKKSFAQTIRFDKWKGWVYLAPALVLLLIFTIWPI